MLLDGSTGSGKTRFCLIPTIDLLTYGDGANGSEPVSIAVTDVKNELIEITGAELERRGYDVLLLDTQNPYRGHRFNPINLVVKLAEKGNSQGAEQAADAIAMVDWQHLFGRFREGQPRLPELDRRHVAQRRVDPEVVVPVHVVRELGP